ncbi:MAG: hypothetical protein ACR2LE_05995 [Nocardioidaceae bacterium]
MEITKVQRWVMSALTLTVAYVWSGGMVLGARYTLDQTRSGAQVAILLLAAVVSVAAVVGVRIINELRWLTPWLLVGLVPSAMGAWVLAAR